MCTFDNILDFYFLNFELISVMCIIIYWNNVELEIVQLKSEIYPSDKQKSTVNSSKVKHNSSFNFV